MKNSDSFALLAWNNYKKNFGKISPFLAVFVVLVLGVLALAYFYPITLILTVPFLVLPSLLCLQIVTMLANKESMNGTNKLKSFFIMFGEYFKKSFRGCYSAINSLLIFFGVFLLIYLVSSLILCYTFLWNDAGFLQMVNALENDRNAYTYEEIINYVMANEAFVRGLDIATIIAFFPAAYFFCHNVFTNSLKVAVDLYLIGGSLDMATISRLHRRSFRTFRSHYYKQYFKCLWPFIPVSLVGYVGGVLFTIFVLGYYSPYACIIGLFAAFILIFAFIPYLFQVIDLCGLNFVPYYIEAGILEANDCLKSIPVDDDETRREIQAYIDTSNEYLKKFKNDKPDDEKQDKK